VFSEVADQVGRVLSNGSAAVLRYGADGSVTVLGSPHGPAGGTHEPADEGEATPAEVARTRRHARVGRSVGAPIFVDDRLYLLKSRVTVVDEFIEALERIHRGGSVVGPSLVHELFSAQRRDDPLSFLSNREREVLALMAEGRSNAGIGRRLWVTEGTVEKHVRSILGKLHLPEAADDHRRVLAVLTFLESR
jgi:DNA-binding CsgD family transcriptional regulator